MPKSVVASKERRFCGELMDALLGMRSAGTGLMLILFFRDDIGIEAR